MKTKGFRKTLLLCCCLAWMGQFLPAQALQKTTIPIFGSEADAKVSIAAGVAKAASENKRMLILFGADACPYCRQFLEALEGSPEIQQQLAADFVFLKVSLEDQAGKPINYDLADIYKVSDFGMPSLAVLDAGARLLTAQSCRVFVGENGYLPGRILAFLKINGREAEPQPLRVGDHSVALKNLKWLKGGATDLPTPGSGSTLALLFWTSRFETSRAVIAYFNVLQERFKAKKLVVASIAEDEEAKLQEFLKDTPAQFPVAVDPGRAIRRKYMGGIEFLPFAFIVTPEGMIAWSGTPGERFTRVLESVLQGTYDAGKEELIRRKENELEMLRRLRGSEASALAKVNELLDLDPGFFPFYQVKIELLKGTNDKDGLQKLLKQLLVRYTNSAADLNELAWSDLNLSYEMIDFDVAWEAAKRAVQLSKGENARMLETLARVLYEVGLIEPAISVQTDLVKKSVGEVLTQARRMLDYFQKVKAAREKIAADLASRKSEGTK